MQNQPRGGIMAAVFADEKRVASAVEPFRETVSIAAINGPGSSVISGVAAHVKRVLQELEAEEIAAKILNVSHAFHSPLMESMLDDLEQTAFDVKYASPQLALISNVTGSLVSNDEVSNAAYWRRHARQPVQFYKSVETLREQGYECFIEIGPSPILLGMTEHCLPAEERVRLPSIRRGRNDWEQMLESLATLYVRGFEIDWTGFDLDYKRRRLVLPNYPFQRKRYWIPETRLAIRKEISRISARMLLRIRCWACACVLPLMEEIVFTFDDNCRRRALFSRIMLYLEWSFSRPRATWRWHWRLHGWLSIPGTVL